MTLWTSTMGVQSSSTLPTLVIPLNTEGTPLNKTIIMPYCHNYPEVPAIVLSQAFLQFLSLLPPVF